MASKEKLIESLESNISDALTYRLARVQGPPKDLLSCCCFFLRYHSLFFPW